MSFEHLSDRRRIKRLRRERDVLYDEASILLDQLDILARPVNRAQVESLQVQLDVLRSQHRQLTLQYQYMHTLIMTLGEQLDLFGGELGKLYNPAG